MRIIAGKYKGRKFDLPKESQTRPTLDRIKENIFNIINFEIPNANCLDLFTGSGALGLECLSRNASQVVFVDEKSENIKNIKNFLNLVKDENGYCLCCDYEDALKKLSTDKKKFDVIFLDPPYDTPFAEKAIKLINHFGLLNDNGIIIWEQLNELNKMENFMSPYKIKNEKKYGTVKVVFLKNEN